MANSLAKIFPLGQFRQTGPIPVDAVNPKWVPLLVMRLPVAAEVEILSVPGPALRHGRHVGRGQPGAGVIEKEGKIGSGDNLFILFVPATAMVKAQS